MDISILCTIMLFLSMSFSARASSVDAELRIIPKKIVSATSSQFPLNHLRQLDWGDWDFSVGTSISINVEFKTPEGHIGQLVEQVEMETMISAPKGKGMSHFAQDSSMRFKLQDVIENVRKKRPDLLITGVSISAVKIWITNCLLAVGGDYLRLKPENLMVETKRMKWPIVMNNSYGEYFEFDFEIVSN